MKRVAIAADGERFEFPEGTPDSVIDAFMKQNAQSKKLKPLPAHEETKPATAVMRGPLSMGEKLKATALQTLRQAPEELGFLAGGALGAGVGAPAGPPGMFLGGAAGAGAGQAAGRGLSEILKQKFPSVFDPTGREAAKSVPEALMDVGKASQEGMMAESAAGLFGPAVRQLSKLTQRNIPPSVQRGLQIAERENIPYTPGDVQPGGPLQVVENFVRGTLFGGRIMTEHSLRSAKELVVLQNKIVNRVGDLVSKEELGTVIRDAVKTTHESLIGRGGLFERLYSRVSILYNAPVNTTKIRSAIEPLLKEVNERVKLLPSLSPAESPSRFKQLLEDLSVFGTQQVTDPSGKISRVDVPINYEQLWLVKRDIDSLIRSQVDDPLRTEAKGMLARIHTILDDAMVEAAQRVSPEAAAKIRNINKMYRDAKELYEKDSLVADIDKMYPDQIARRFFGPDAVSKPKELLAALSPKKRREVLPAIQRRKIEDLLTLTSRELEDTRFTSGQLLSNRFYKEREGLEFLFSDKRGLATFEGLKEFIEASRFSQSSSHIINPASGRQLLAFAQLASLSTVGYSFLTGDLKESGFHGAATALIAPPILAKMLTHPGTARLLAKGFKMSPKAAGAAAWSARVQHLFDIAQQYDDQAEGYEDKAAENAADQEDDLRRWVRAAKR